MTGQDGAHLAEFLLSKGYVVHGMRAAVGEHGVDDDAAMWIEPVRIGEGDQSRLSFGHGTACQLRPTVEQKRPLIVMAWLAYLSFHAGSRRPIRSKEFA